MCHNYFTLRSQAYFGSSVHVYHGIQMVASLYQELFSDMGNLMHPKVSAMDIIFRTNFLSLGILIFLGVEQGSKHLIKWPTILFTLLLASRFVVEILKEVKARDTDFVQKMTPLDLNMDANPIASAAVGIYIFLLFVYNHSLEFENSSSTSRCARNLATETADGSSGTCAGDVNDDCRNNGFDDRTRLLPHSGSQALASPIVQTEPNNLNDSRTDHSTIPIGRNFHRRSSNNFQPLVNDEENNRENVHFDRSTMPQKPDNSSASLVSLAIQENEGSDNITVLPKSNQLNITENIPLVTNSPEPAVATGSGTLLQMQNIEKPTDKGDCSWTYTPFEFFHKKSKPSRFFAQNKIDAV